MAERQAAVEAILSAGHIPAGMELFAAGDRDQMNVIRDWIRESDVFMLILGTRYGSLGDTDLSYVELEYDYAKLIKKPYFACVINKDIIDARIRTMGSAATEDRGDLLAAFRAKVLKSLCRFWRDGKEIQLAVHQSLREIEDEEHLIGWIRGDQVQTDQVAAENALGQMKGQISALQEEAAKREEQVRELQTSLKQAEIRLATALEAQGKIQRDSDSEEIANALRAMKSRILGLPRVAKPD